MVLSKNIHTTNDIATSCQSIEKQGQHTSDEEKKLSFSIFKKLYVNNDL